MLRTRRAQSALIIGPVPGKVLTISDKLRARSQHSRRSMIALMSGRDTLLCTRAIAHGCLAHNKTITAYRDPEN